MDLSGKTVLVVGAGKSGVESCRFLLTRCQRVLLSDSKPREQLDSEVDKLESEGVEILPGNQLPEKVSWQLVVTSPGVPPMIPLLMMSREAGVEVIGEVELAYRFSHVPFLGVTGTNGKTTTTALLGHILRQSGVDVLVGGNIGTPLVAAAAEYNGNYIVAELSSFQLESCFDFTAHVGVFINLSPDHLDRHGSMEAYAAAKEKMFTNQEKVDFAVLNYDDECIRSISGRTAARSLFFSLFQQLDDGMYWEDGAIKVAEQGRVVYTFPADDIYIKGRHNMQNCMAAALAAFAVGVSYEQIKKALASFPGVEHRLEFVCTRDGVTYINDSKATNPDSTWQALNSYNQPLVLLMGGYDKGADFSPLFELINKKVRQLIIYGKTLPRIKTAADEAGFNAYVLAENFRDAVRLGQELAQPGDVVMLSPACASWDEFTCFEERGLLFKQLVRGK